MLMAFIVSFMTKTMHQDGSSFFTGLTTGFTFVQDTRANVIFKKKCVIKIVQFIKYIFLHWLSFSWFKKNHKMWTELIPVMNHICPARRSRHPKGLSFAFLSRYVCICVKFAVFVIAGDELKKILRFLVSNNHCIFKF